jgi:hypothetical protein
VVLAALLLLRGRHKAISKIKRRPYLTSCQALGQCGWVAKFEEKVMFSKKFRFVFVIFHSFDQDSDDELKRERWNQDEHGCTRQKGWAVQRPR